MFRRCLNRWLIIPAMALGMTIFAGVGNAQFGRMPTWCLSVPVPPGWHQVGKPYYSIQCEGRGINAITIAPD